MKRATVALFLAFLGGLASCGPPPPKREDVETLKKQIESLNTKLDSLNTELKRVEKRLSEREKDR